MIKNIKWLSIFALTLSFIACDDTEETTVVSNSSDGLALTAGTANFSKYVSLGNSLTAGFSDGALFIEGQKGSFTNILATKFADVGGGTFKIPYMNDNVGGFIGGNPSFGPRLYFNGAAPVPVSGTPTTNPTTVLAGPFNNMGVPGAKSFHLVANGYGQLNPYFGRFATSPTTSVIADAMAQTPTFFSLWIGNNDVLAYAMSGGTGANQTGNLNLATYGMNDITDPNVFTNVYNGLVNALTSAGAKGVVANIPYVDSTPFFTTIPYNPVPVDAATAASLNAQLITPFSAILTALGHPGRLMPLAAGSSNPLLIKDESLVDLSAQITAYLTPTYGAATAGFLGATYGQARHATSADLIPLTTKASIGATQAGVPAPYNVIGVTYPMEDKLALTADEKAQIKTATDAYNATISATATAKGLAFVDTNAIMQQIANGGIKANGFTVTSAFVTGGGFSLDGVHPSPRGQALIANKFLEAINTKYGSNFKGVDIGLYRILFPAQL